MSRLTDTGYALDKLAWMRKERIWPHGLRYLWTDAFGLVLLVSLYEALRDETYRSGDEYDRNAITHMMACSSHFPGLLVRD